MKQMTLSIVLRFAALLSFISTITPILGDEPSETASSECMKTLFFGASSEAGLTCASNVIAFDRVNFLSVEQEYQKLTTPFATTGTTPCNCGWQAEGAASVSCESPTVPPTCPIEEQCSASRLRRMLDLVPTQSCLVDGMPLPKGTIVGACSNSDDTVDVNLGMIFTVTNKPDYVLHDVAITAATDGGSVVTGSSCTTDTILFPKGQPFDDSNYICVGDVDGDICKDILNGSSGYIAVSTDFTPMTLKCADTNEDGLLDFEVGVSWYDSGGSQGVIDEQQSVGCILSARDGTMCSTTRVTLPIFVPKKSETPSAVPSSMPSSVPSLRPSLFPSESLVPSDLASLRPSDGPSLSLSPVVSPVTLSPVVSPVTLKPVVSPVTLRPVVSPVTLKPVVSPVTLRPVGSPVTKSASPLGAKVTLAGSVSLSYDKCSLGQTDQKLVTTAMSKQINDRACDSAAVENCKTTITSDCGKVPETGRRLQDTSSWQVQFEVILTFICNLASATCSNEQGASSGVVDQVVTTFRASLQDRSFATGLSTNAELISGLTDSSILGCLVAWGVIRTTEDETAAVIAAAAAAAAAAGGGGNSAIAAQNLYYPDWEQHTGTCLNDGNEPGYMTKFATSWLFDNLQGCCDRYYVGWNYNKCMNTQGSGLWFVSYENLKCVTDCEPGSGETCGGLANPVSDDLYLDPRSCCNSELEWVYIEYCVTQALGSESCNAGNGEYYRGSKVCVRNCDKSSDPTCGGVVDASWVALFSTPEACCDEHYDWIDNELCAGRSSLTAVEKFWPEMTMGKCFKDSDTPTEDLDVSIYATVQACCSDAIYWVSLEDCVAASAV